MDELNLAFTEYIESFKILEVKEKRKEIIQSVNEISVLINILAQQENKELHFLKSREILDLKDGLEKEDDFLEALLVYIENSKNLLAQYLEDKI